MNSESLTDNRDLKKRRNKVPKTDQIQSALTARAGQTNTTAIVVIYVGPFADGKSYRCVLPGGHSTNQWDIPNETEIMVRISPHQTPKGAPTAAQFVPGRETAVRVPGVVHVSKKQKEAVAAAIKGTEWEDKLDSNLNLKDPIFYELDNNGLYSVNIKEGSFKSFRAAVSHQEMPSGKSDWRDTAMTHMTADALCAAVNLQGLHVKISLYVKDGALKVYAGLNAGIALLPNTDLDQRLRLLAPRCTPNTVFDTAAIEEALAAGPHKICAPGFFMRFDPRKFERDGGNFVYKGVGFGFQIEQKDSQLHGAYTVETYAVQQGDQAVQIAGNRDEPMHRQLGLNEYDPLVPEIMAHMQLTVAAGLRTGESDDETMLYCRGHVIPNITASLQAAPWRDVDPELVKQLIGSLERGPLVAISNIGKSPLLVCLGQQGGYGCDESALTGHTFRGIVLNKKHGLVDGDGPIANQPPGDVLMIYAVPEQTPAPGLDYSEYAGRFAARREKLLAVLKARISKLAALPDEEGRALFAHCRQRWKHDWEPVKEAFEEHWAAAYEQDPSPAQWQGTPFESESQ